jgi:hypothetical protein
MFLRSTNKYTHTKKSGSSEGDVTQQALKVLWHVTGNNFIAVGYCGSVLLRYTD